MICSMNAFVTASSLLYAVDQSAGGLSDDVTVRLSTVYMDWSVTRYTFHPEKLSVT